MKLRSLWLIATIASCLGMASTSDVYRSNGGNEPPLFFSPTQAAVPQVLDAIRSAQKSFHMEMYHLTNADIIDALIAANSRGIDVQVILDAGGVTHEKPTGAFHRLSDAGVKVFKSSSAFSLTHTKSFVVDGSQAYIMSMNLTSIVPITRDVGLITDDSAVVNFVEDLIKTDEQNANSQGMASPSSIPNQIVLSPVNSRDRLVNLINSATESLQVSVENISDTAIINALLQAKQRGVKVEILLPRCDLSSADFDMPAAQQLDAGGVVVHMMPAPMTADTPYIHQKSIVVDGVKGFLGSENFSFNSLDHGRELGILFDDPSKARQLTDVYNQDAAKSLNLSQAQAYKCPAKPFAGSSDILN